MTEIEKLIKGCLNGDRRDQELLYRRYSPRLYGACLQYTGNDEEARDVLQEGFIKIFGSLAQYKNEGSFEGWMRRIIVNTALEKYRRRYGLYRVDDIDTVDESETLQNTEEYTGLEVEDMLELIRNLPPKYRMVFNLYAIEGYSHKEIGSLMGITEGTSKSNLSRARAILQRRLEIYMGIKWRVANAR